MAIRTALVGSILSAAAASGGGNVKLAWSDCGDSSTHGHITSLSPDSLTLGSKTSLSGKGKVDEAINSATYKVDAKAAGITVFSHNGDACKPETIKLPAGAGEIDMKGFSCPISAGAVELDLDVSLSAAIPSSLARVIIDLTATASSGDKALCVQIKTSPGMAMDSGDANMYIPRGLRIENATEAEIEIARSMQFEKDFENGDYQSDLDVARGMANCNQKCSNWCWATSATMAASAFGGGSKCVTEEEEVAGHEFHTSCDGSCSSKCNKGGTTGEIADGIKFLSGHSYSSGGALSQKRLDSALRHGPVVIGVQWTLGGGHAITISGGSGGKYTGHDPEGYAINTNYGGLTTYKPPYAQGRYTGKWFGSAYTSSGEALMAVSEGGTVKLAWSDCGDSSTHGHITSLSPDTLTLGAKTSLAGKGKVDEAIESATYKVDAKAAGITVFSHNGDACKPETIKLPAGAGEIDMKGFSCPISAGAVELDLDVSLSAAIPSSLARITIDLTAASSSGDKALCVQIKTSPGTTKDTIVV